MGSGIEPVRRGYAVRLDRSTMKAEMGTCDVCGNAYAKAFEVRTADGDKFTFDSIECAVSKIAPECAHCGCRVLGHGIQDGEQVYCCAHCARNAGVEQVADNSANPA